MSLPLRMDDDRRRLTCRSAGKIYGIVLPAPPSANRWWRNFGGRMVKSPEARAYQDQVYLRARASGMRPIRKPADVSVSIVWYRNRRSGDLDKRLGVLLDALQGAAFESDAQIIELYARRVDITGDARVEVTIYEVEAEAPVLEHRRGKTA